MLIYYNMFAPIARFQILKIILNKLQFLNRSFKKTILEKRRGKFKPKLFTQNQISLANSIDSYLWFFLCERNV